MPTSHFDILVLGSSPAARMAATLCAKGGKKVLLLDSDQAPPAAPWCHASLHLERLLETLGGRACLRPTPAFQIHAGNTRLTLHGRQSLTAEWLRECGQEQPQILRLLETLQRQGLQLEELLLRCHGLPLTGFGSRMRFLWQLLRRGQLPGRLRQPLSQTLSPLGTTARAALNTLFSGLALTSATELTTAEAALLWHCASRIEALHWEPFNQLLSKRLEQFHGKTESAQDLQQIKRRGDRRFELTLKGHPAATATWLVLGDAQMAHKLPEELAALDSAAAPRQRFAASFSHGRPSALLAPGVLLEQPWGLRLTLPSAAGEPLLIEAGGSPTTDSDQLLLRVEAALPFTSLTFVTTTQEPALQLNTPGSKPRRQAFPGARSAIKLAPGLLSCHGQNLLPHLGLPGEAILGTTVANHLLATRQDRSR